jgi:hypothetical protein
VHVRAVVASDAGRIAQVLPTHLQGMPTRAIRSDPHNVRTISWRRASWCAYSERVGAAIRSSSHPRVVGGDSYQWDSGRARIGAWPRRAPDQAVLSEPYLRIRPSLEPGDTYPSTPDAGTCERIRSRSPPAHLAHRRLGSGRGGRKHRVPHGADVWSCRSCLRSQRTSPLTHLGGSPSVERNLGVSRSCQRSHNTDGSFVQCVASRSRLAS